VHLTQNQTIVIDIKQTKLLAIGHQCIARFSSLVVKCWAWRGFNWCWDVGL